MFCHVFGIWIFPSIALETSSRVPPPDLKSRRFRRVPATKKWCSLLALMYFCYNSISSLQRSVRRIYRCWAFNSEDSSKAVSGVSAELHGAAYGFVGAVVSEAISTSATFFSLFAASPSHLVCARPLFRNNFFAKAETLRLSLWRSGWSCRRRRCFRLRSSGGQ